MSISSFIAGILITTIVVFRAFTVKIGTKKFSSHQITFANNAFMVLLILLTVPFMKSLLVPFSMSHIKGFTAAIIKGLLLYASLKCTADISKESNSSSVFAGYVSLGIGAILNHFIFKEVLSTTQILACISLSILGTVFFFRGPVSDLSRFGKSAFIKLTLIIIVIMCVDNIGIKGLNWYMYSLTSSSVSLLISLIFIIKNRQYKYFQELVKPELMAIGIVFFLGEFIILYSMQYFLPVSIAFLFLRLSAPIVMFLSAYIYKERTPHEQLMFGSLALGLASLLILG